MTSIKTVLICAILMVPFAAGQNDKKSGDAANGKSVYEGQCADCHLADSTEAKGGPGLKGIKNGKLPSGKPATYETILAIINSGTDAMPGFKDVLTEKEKDDIIAYVLTL